MLGLPREWPEVFDALVELREADTAAEAEIAQEAERERKRDVLARALRASLGR